MSGSPNSLVWSTPIEPPPISPSQSSAPHPGQRNSSPRRSVRPKQVRKPDRDRVAPVVAEEKTPASPGYPELPAEGSTRVEKNRGHPGLGNLQNLVDAREVPEGSEISGYVLPAKECGICNSGIGEKKASSHYGSCSHSYHLDCLRRRGINPFECFGCNPQPISSLYPAPPRVQREEKKNPKRRAAPREPDLYTVEGGYGISNPMQSELWRARLEDEQLDHNQMLQKSEWWVSRLVTSVRQSLVGPGRPNVKEMMANGNTPKEMAENGVLVGDFIDQKITIPVLREYGYNTVMAFRKQFPTEFGLNTLVAMDMKLVDLLHEDSPCFAGKPDFRKEFKLNRATPIQLLRPDVEQVLAAVHLLPRKNKFKRLSFFEINADYLVRAGMDKYQMMEFPLSYEEWCKGMGLREDQIRDLGLQVEDMLDMKWPEDAIEKFYPGWKKRTEEMYDQSMGDYVEEEGVYRDAPFFPGEGDLGNRGFASLGRREAGRKTRRNRASRPPVSPSQIFIPHSGPPSFMTKGKQQQRGRRGIMKT